MGRCNGGCSRRATRRAYRNACSSPLYAPQMQQNTVPYGYGTTTPNNMLGFPIAQQQQQQQQPFIGGRRQRRPGLIRTLVTSLMNNHSEKQALQGQQEQVQIQSMSQQQQHQPQTQYQTQGANASYYGTQSPAYREQNREVMGGDGERGVSFKAVSERDWVDVDEKGEYKERKPEAGPPAYGEVVRN